MVLQGNLLKRNRSYSSAFPGFSNTDVTVGAQVATLDIEDKDLTLEMTDQYGRSVQVPEKPVDCHKSPEQLTVMLHIYMT